MDRNSASLILPLSGAVALRKESVDRNDNYNLHCVEEVSSLSARRAWIEIWLCGRLSMLISVALRKESVDRNKMPVPYLDAVRGRSPQGERG